MGLSGELGPPSRLLDGTSLGPKLPALLRAVGLHCNKLQEWQEGDTAMGKHRAHCCVPGAAAAGLGTD